MLQDRLDLDAYVVKKYILTLYAPIIIHMVHLLILSNTSRFRNMFIVHIYDKFVKLIFLES